MNKGDKYMWKYLLDKGDVITEWDFYGGYYKVDKKETQKCRKAVKKHGIDWDQTSIPYDGVQAAFDSTFGDDAMIKTLTGTLIVNGARYKWGIKLDSPKNILNFIADILPDPFE